MDFSESATDALRFALPFARETGARLDLLHVIEPVTTIGLAGEGAVSVRQTGNKQLQRDAAARLKQIAAAEIRRPVRAHVFVAEGQPAPVIASIALRQQSDLVVISTHGHSGLQRLFLGSTAEAIVRQSPCPVLTVRLRVLSRQGTPQSPPSERINRILVPVDFSRPSREMLIYAANFALRFRASLVLLHVVDHISVPTRIAYSATGLQMVVLNEGMTKLADWAKSLVPDGVETEQLVKAGTPYVVINRIARQLQVDLIIIATHGRSGFLRLFLGSTAACVLRHARCPVLVVRQPKGSRQKSPKRKHRTTAVPAAPLPH